jgi:arabinose-5-phosphate isomerase
LRASAAHEHAAMDDLDLRQHLCETLRREGRALLDLADDLRAQDSALIGACKMILKRCDGRPGRLALTGVGKAGLIARKIAATCASTGTPSFFLHPSEARHGDLGMVQADDVVLALSNSGASEEVVDLLPALRRIGCAVIALVGQADSALARHADLSICYGKVLEACPLGLAPTTSTTVMLALGDALALAVQSLRAFTPEDYARFHPGGALGRKLMCCRDAMRSRERIAVVGPDCPVIETMRVIGAARTGSALIADADDHLLGIFTDGDLRRALTGSNPADAVLHAPVRAYASLPCTSIGADELLQRALHLCATRRFNELPVVDSDGRIAGLLDLQDLAQRGFEIPAEMRV